MSILDFFSTKPETQPAPPETDELRLAAVDDELRRSEAELAAAGKSVADFNTTTRDLRTSIAGGDTFVQLGAMRANLERQNLEAERDCALQKFQAILRKRSELMMRLGLIR